MRLSNKSTFSLACLLLLLAFVVVPVMAHVVPVVPATDPVTFVQDHNDSTDLDHAIVKSITVDNQYLTTTNIITATVTFEAAKDGILDDDETTDVNERVTGITDPNGFDDGSDITVELKGAPDAEGNPTFTTESQRLTVTSVNLKTQPTAGVGAVYVIFISVPSGAQATEDGEYRISVSESIAYSFDSAKAMVTRDVGAPMVDTAAVAPQGNNLIPVDGLLSQPFRLTFNVMGLTEDLKSITFKAVPAVLSFGTVGGLGGMQYAVNVGYENANVTVGTEVVVTITATDKAGNTGTSMVTVTLAKRTATDTGGTTPTQPVGTTDPTPGRETTTGTYYSPKIDIPAESFVVVVVNDTTEKLLQAYDPDIETVIWSTMPDLELFFDTGAPTGGGALILTESVTQNKDYQRTPGTVGISEVMWAIDESKIGKATDQKANQWVELHNLNLDTTDDETPGTDNGSVAVVLSARAGATAISTDSAINGNLGHPRLDVVTNAFHDRPGNAFWALPGQNGNPGASQNFVSMARNPKRGAFSATRRHENNAGKARDGLYTRFGDGGANGANQSLDGRNKDSWKASTTPYARGTVPLGLGLGNATFDYVGTPGRVNTFSPQRATVKVGRTSVASDNILINEVGNLSGSNHDWIELRNNSTGEINLRNYLISKVTSNSSDSPLIQFNANDNAKVAVGGVFLLLRTDPADDPSHPIAATGYNVDKSVEEQEPGTPNSSVRYKVFGSLDLPDDGIFVLIVRRPDNHEGQRSGAHGGKGVAETGNADLDKIVDIAGWDDDLSKSAYPNSVSSTSLWPLHSFAAPSFSNNKFEVNKVHQRNRVTTNDGRSGVGAEGNNNDKTAFGDRGWTGVGYRRAVTNSAMHGGTPGYPNGASHGAGDDITSAVYISEIMYADSGNGTLPQWIEIRNTSNTEGADLHNWRLTIKNHADKTTFEDGLWDGKYEASVLLRNLKIKPNSSVLVTSRKGPRSEVHLAANEIFSIFPANRTAFGMTNANSDVISPFGFRITLHANGHEGDRAKWQLVDDVGNLATSDATDRRGNNERLDMPRWALPDAVDEDETRSSIARTNNAAQGLGDGSMAGSWILSSMDGRTSLIDYVYYGHTDDISTPGQTRESPLPVSLSFFRPTLEDGKIVIRWTTESELDNAGFNILRSEDRNGEFTKVNDQLIQGKGTTAERSTYKWVDASAKPGAVYYYQIEDVSFAGERNTLTTTKLKGLISAENKLATKWGELKEVQ